MSDPELADFIIEKRLQSNRRKLWLRDVKLPVVYRLKCWRQELRRYEFLGDYNYIGQVYNRLREEGIVEVDQVPVVDLVGD